MSAGSVLVIEDNRDLCENLSEILGGRGFHVETATTAKSGAARAREARPDVALVDLNLPDGRGMDVVGEIRRGAPDTACVIFTGNASLESAVEAVNRGAYAYLLKGGRIEDVIATVERAAERVRLEREKARLERALRDERNFSRAIVSNAALGIAVFAPDGRALELNQQMRALIGGEVADAAGLAALGRDDGVRERIRVALSRLAEESFEVDVVLRDERERTWKISTSQVAGEGGRREAVVAVAADVTGERELQRRVVAASRLAAIGEMAARVAHEIRNPLAGIAGAIRVLGRGLEGDPKREPFFRELLALVSRLNAFVEDLLVFARPLKIAKEDVALAALLEPVRTVLREHPVVRGVTIEAEDWLGRPLQVDRHHFAMALQNLILNAAQASKGKGRVRIEALSGRDGCVLVRVDDDGPGIAPGVLPHIFEAFTTTRIEGTGLGLSTTKRIVEAHGGAIAAANRPEGGARFEIALPPPPP
jgi:two-component system sensor histidine kinase PilS (NtrC family)